MASRDTLELAVTPAGRPRVRMRRARAIDLRILLTVTVVLAASAWVMPGYWVSVCTQVFLVAELAVAWNLLAGLIGYVSLGIQGFYGLGAYGAAVAMATYHLPLAVGLLAAIAVGCCAALIVGLPVLRLRGHYFLIGTFAAGSATGAVFYAVGVFGTVPGGSIYLPLSSLSARGFGVLVYYLGLGALAVGVTLFTLVRWSKPGLALAAIKGNETAAEGLGVPAFRLKLMAFVLSGALAALGGGIAGYLATEVQPAQVFDLTLLIQVIVAAVLGGIATTWGPVIGAAFVVLITQLSASFATIDVMIYAVLVILVVLVDPGGLVSLSGKAARAARAGRRAVARRAPGVRDRWPWRARDGGLS